MARNFIIPMTLLLALAGCETPRTTTGERAADAERPTAQAEERGVRVETRAETWPGEQSVRDVVTPLVVRIDNNSDAPVDVRYSQLSLTMPDGTRYRALPPFRMADDGRGARSDDAIQPIESPAFRASGFRVAPYYRAIYPTLETYQNVFLYNSPYYGRTWPYWENTDLPTEDMLTRALPEGVVLPDGELEGWVYFEKVPDTEDIAVLRSNFLHSENRRRYAVVQVPFNIQD